MFTLLSFTKCHEWFSIIGWWCVSFQCQLKCLSWNVGNLGRPNWSLSKANLFMTSGSNPVRFEVLRSGFVMREGGNYRPLPHSLPLSLRPEAGGWRPTYYHQLFQLSGLCVTKELSRDQLRCDFNETKWIPFYLFKIELKIFLMLFSLLEILLQPRTGTRVLVQLTASLALAHTLYGAQSHAHTHSHSLSPLAARSYDWVDQPLVQTKAFESLFPFSTLQKYRTSKRKMKRLHHFWAIYSHNISCSIKSLNSFPMKT